MKVIGKVNAVHKETAPPKLKPGQTVVYQLLCGVVNPDNEQRARVPILYPQSITIPSKDRIIDPKTEEFVDIAIVENFTPVQGGEAIIKPFKLAIRAKENNGFFSCTGGNVREEEIYEYCELTNYNESNPHRDTSIEPLFKRVDAEKDSKERSKKRSIRIEAEKYANAMTNGDVREFAASMNWNENEPIDILRDKVEQFAFSQPELFSEKVMAKDKDAKVIIKRAIDAGKISYDTAQHRIVLAGQTLIKLERVEGADWLTQAAEFCLHNQKGDKVLQTIKKLLAE